MGELLRDGGTSMGEIPSSGSMPTTEVVSFGKDWT